MEKREAINIELKEISPVVAEIQFNNTWSAPAGYFDNLADSILQRITAGEEPVYHFTVANPYTVPREYFNKLADSIISMINTGQRKNEVAEELEAVAPVLNTINKAPHYYVPEGYFDNLKAPEAAPSQSPAKVVRISPWRRFEKYAIAAALTSVIAVGAYFFNRDPVFKGPTAKVIEKANTLSEDELIQYLQSDMPNEQVTTSSPKMSQEVELSKTVKQMTDKEIQQYLSEMGEKVEI